MYARIGGTIGIVMFGGFAALAIGLTIGSVVPYHTMQTVVGFSGYNAVAAFIVCAILGQARLNAWTAIVTAGYFILSMVAPVVLFIGMIRAGVLAQA